MLVARTRASVREEHSLISRLVVLPQMKRIHSSSLTSREADHH